MAEVVTLASRASVRVPKAAELVAAHIRRGIITGELQQGDALAPESSLMQDFGISRPTLREAFRILESEGLIIVLRGARGGARVQAPSSDVAARYAALVLQHRNTTLADVMDARVIIEGPAARIVAERRNRKSASAKLEGLLESPQMRGAAAFHEFNRLLVRLTENQTLILLTAMIEHIAEAAALHYSGPPDHGARLQRRAVNARRKLIESIRSADAESAEELWTQHLREAGDALVEGTDGALVELFD
jgi:GntR family transcriptional regulator, transcriptional repressor for pyruvate dehydrogenase complex